MSKRVRIIIGVFVGALALAAIVVTLNYRNLEPRLRAWIVENLEASLDSKVELGAIYVTWTPMKLHASDLVVRHHGRTDIPPVFVVSHFTIDLHPMDLFDSTIDNVSVDGLEINIPPKDPETRKRPMPRLGKDGKDNPDDKDDGEGLLIRHLVATNTRLSMIPSKQGKNPKVWDIFELDMRDIGRGQASSFTAALINPIPYGKVESKGTFGPWHGEEPGDSPVGGEYTFAADLGTIDGLGGSVNAMGTMSGTLDQIQTTGETQTPDFKLTEVDGISLPLHTSYEALVDGTNGDVELKRVDIQLGKSKMLAKGLVEGTKGIKGKRVIVNVKSNASNLGELLRFVSKSKAPPVDGLLVIDAAMDLPQGKAKILSRLGLEGSVKAERVTFNKGAVQDKIDDLSRRGQGKPGDTSIQNVTSQMETKFVLNNGLLTYRGLSFNVNGASIRVDGTHSLRTKAFDLAGVVMLDATVSNTMTGFKSILLKPLDPLFKKKGAGTRLVVTIGGTQDQPKIDIDFGKSIKGKSAKDK